MMRSGLRINTDYEKPPAYFSVPPTVGCSGAAFATMSPLSASTTSPIASLSSLGSLSAASSPLASPLASPIAATKVNGRGSLLAVPPNASSRLRTGSPLRTTHPAPRSSSLPRTTQVSHVAMSPPSQRYGRGLDPAPFARRTPLGLAGREGIGSTAPSRMINSSARCPIRALPVKPRSNFESTFSAFESPLGALNSFPGQRRSSSVGRRLSETKAFGEVEASSFGSQQTVDFGLSKLTMEQQEEFAVQCAIRDSLAEAAQAAEIRRKTELEAEDEKELQDALKLSLQHFEDVRGPRTEDHSPSSPPSPTPSGLPSTPTTESLAATFEPEQWLTDASLKYAFSALSKDSGGPYEELNGEVNAGSPLPKDVVFVDPAAAFWFALETDPEALQKARTSLKLKNAKLVLCPVNDSQERFKADSGAHWSLLVAWRGSEDFFSVGPKWRCLYYDSLGVRVSSVSKLTRVTVLAERLLGEAVAVGIGRCARQVNSFDCGLYVLVFSRWILLAALKHWDARGYSAELDPSLWEEYVQAVSPKLIEEHRQFLWQKASIGEY